MGEMMGSRKKVPASEELRRELRQEIEDALSDWRNGKKAMPCGCPA